MPMKRLHLTLRFIFVALLTFHCGWGNGTQVLSPKSQKSLEALVKKFADSYILGTGASHFVTSIKVIDTNNALAVVGEISDRGRDANTYTVYAKQSHQKWKIVKYEFVSQPTGKKESIDQSPPFPYPNWEKDAP